MWDRANHKLRTRVLQMPFLKSHMNSDDSDEPEEGQNQEEENEVQRSTSAHEYSSSEAPEKNAVDSNPETEITMSSETDQYSTQDESAMIIAEDEEAESEETSELDYSPSYEIPVACESPVFEDVDLEFGPDESELKDLEDRVTSLDTDEEDTISELVEDESEAYVGGNIGLYYLRGVLCHQKMNLDDAIHFLGQALEFAVEMDMFDYVVKSQIQLASVYLKRYRIHGDKKDYYSSLHYSENLIQIAKELELDELWTEALLLRAILRKIAQDAHGARDDLNQARAMAKSIGQESIEILVEHELQEVRRLVARERRRKGKSADVGDSMMDDALEAIPAIFDESLKLEVSRESLEISVELNRLVIMNLSSGLPLYSYSFEGLKNDKDDLVYGFLSALSHLAAEVMDSPGMIRSISHEGSTVMMEHRGAYMAALFSSREDFRARQSLQKFLKEFLRLLPEMRLGEVVTEEYRTTADEMLLRIFKAFL